MIKAVIFDMDGLLINSEPFWRTAEMEAFLEVGIKLNDRMCQSTMGLKLDEVIDKWSAEFPDVNFSKKKIKKEITKKLLKLIGEEGNAKDGVSQVIDFFENKNIKIAIASSSDEKIIKAVLSKLGIERSFSVICSAENEEFGKPHPGVYLSTAKRLGINPLECLAFEDSLNGLISAKAAKMKCVMVPDKLFLGDKKLSLADEIVISLSDFNEMTWRRLNKN